jgi:hypothetical protein
VANFSLFLRGEVLKACEPSGLRFGMQLTYRIASLIALCTALTAQADITVTPPNKKKAKEEEFQKAPPPEPVPVNVRVKRGGAIDIPLRVFGVPSQQLTYRIRELPESGKLSGPQMIARGIGVVTYQHSGDRAAENDHFLYAVRTADGVSASVRVNIIIVDDPPKLSVLEDWDFGTIIIGSTATKEITLTNLGGGLLNGGISLDEPWKIDGKPTYSLRAGESQSFKLTFAPQSEETFRGVVRFSSHPLRPTTLYAVAVGAIAVTPRRLELTPARDTIRGGALKIANRTSEDQPLRLHTGSRLVVPEQVVVPANGDVSVPVETVPDIVDAFDEEVQVDSPGFGTKIAIHVPAVGAMLGVQPTTLSLGKIEAGRTANATLQVSNSGGTNALVQIRAPAAIVLAAADSSFWLTPGGTRDVNVLVQPVEAGAFRESLNIKAPGGEIDVPIEAEVSAPPPVVRTPPSRVIAPVVEATPKQLIENVRLKRLTSETCEIEWQVAEGNRDLRYEIERLAPSARGFDWVAISNVEIKAAELPKNFSGKNLAMHGVADPEEAAHSAAPARPPTPKFIAQLKALTSDTVYKIRIVTIDPKDAANRPSFALAFRTSQTLTQTPAFRWSACAVVAFAVFVIWRRSRGSAESADRKPIAERKPAAVHEAKTSPVSIPSTFIPGGKAKPGRGPVMREVAPGRFELDIDE